ncbi:hypothetical protein RR48_09619 [Papilio machaon]|uniref:Uncharacterized protein n=1 Tax=Papilio machaon TaxID=76193 RepID=A0A194QZT0_PAPMA|nr:hypothetical protein RR48_09619 [Papilio machaon]
MQQKWKCIISNWINCYFYDNNNKHEPQVNQELLLNIINHLRQNFNLNESKSSIFSGQTLEEFIAEKFPGFMFENGTLQAVTEDDIFIAASLLLFFVCVNSKDVNIKSAMCSKLSASDQEIILKFSKTLMACSNISPLDVVAAITEACGPDMSTGEGSGRSLVAETPPALRSLHGEVRRLQAALDAERFDRNYLQDELARTNLKLEKLVKDKEQYKIDIVNLKAKISMCCGQESEVRDGETDSSEISKLTKQLQQMEQRLVDVQEELDEVKHERDTLKTKLDNLKCECDRLIMLNQQESSQATQLAEELENERRLSQSLRELVIELRQHNQRNGLDASMECDDPDTSVQSLQRSFSVCNDVCAVVEVQLGEERAKIEALKQQINVLQDECNGHQQNVNTFKKIISDKENENFDLKHRINEEIEDKNNLKCFFDNEITKLNNIVNELEQKLKSQSEQCKMINEKHLHEVQTLQEEKMSLLQSLSDQAKTSDNQIKELKEALDTEKASKNNMRDDYENRVMKLKEKVLNRNNELVELQNKILQKSEVIEQISLELRKEKELNNAKINELTNDLTVLNGQKIKIEKDLQEKCLDIAKLIEKLHKRDVSIDNLNKELECFKTSAANLKEECRILEETKQSLLDDVQNRQVSAEKMRKELDNLRQLHSEEKDKIQCKVDEMCAMVKSLQTQLQNEIDFKIGLQHELEKTQGVITKLSNTNTKLNTELSETVTKMQEKEEIIMTKDLALQEERDKCSNLKRVFDELNVNIGKVSNEVLQKSQIIEEYEKLNKSLQEEITKNSEKMSTLHTELENLNKEKMSLQISIESLNNEKHEIIKEKDLLLRTEKEKLGVLKKECHSLQTFIESLKNDSNKFIKEKDLLLQKEKETQEELKKEYGNLQTFVESLKNEKDKIIKEKDLLLHKEMETHDVLKKEYDNQQSFVESLKKEKDEIIKEKDLLLHKEKEAHEVLKKECDSLQMYVESLKNEKDTFIKDTDLLFQKEKETYDVLKKEYDSLQTFLELSKKEKDEIIKEKDLLLHKEKEAHEVLKKECNSLKTNLEKLSSELILKDKLIQDCNNNLEHLNTAFQNKITKSNEIIDSLKADLIKVNAEKQCLQELINSLTDEKNEIIAEKEEILRNEKELYNKLKQDDEKIKTDLVKASKELTIKDTLLKEYEVKLTNSNNYCQTEISKYKEKIDLLNQDLTIANAQEHKLQDTIRSITQEKDVIIKETEAILQAEKEMHAKLKQDYNKLNKDIEQLNIDTKEKDKIIQKCEKEVQHLNKCLQDEVNKNTEIITSINGDLKSVNVEKENLHKTIMSLNDEKNNLIKIVNEKSNIISELESERESLSRKMEEKGATIHGLEKKLQDKMLAFMEIENNFGVEISKLMTKLSDAEKTFKDIKAKSNKIIENQELQIQSLNGDIFTLKGKLENSLKEIGKLENKLKDINMKYDKERKDYQNKCNSLEEANNMMKNEIVLKETSICELDKKNTLLSSVVTELEKEELKIEKDNLNEERNVILSRIADVENEKLILKNEVLPKLKEDNLRLTKLVDEDKTVITNLEKLMKEKSEQNDKLCQDYDAEKVTLANKCQVLEENLKEAELNLNKRNAEINELRKELEICISDAKHRETELQENNKTLLEQYEEKEMKIHKLIQDLEEEKANMTRCQQELQSKEIRILELKQRLNMAETENRGTENEKLHYTETLKKKDEECALLRNENNEWKIKMDALEVEFKAEKNSLQNELQTQVIKNEQLAQDLELKIQQSNELNNKLLTYNNEMTELKKEINDIKNENEKISNDNNVLIQDNNNNIAKLNNLQKEFIVAQNELTQIKQDNLQLKSIVETYESEIINLENIIKKEMKQNDHLFMQNIDNLDINDKCRILKEFNTKIEQALEQRRTEINALKEEIKIVTTEAKIHETDLKQKNEMLTKTLEEKDDVILKINEELAKEKILNGEYHKQVQLHQNDISELEKKLSQLKDDVDRNNWETETNDADRIEMCGEVEARVRGRGPHSDAQVHSSSSDITHSATEKNKIISDLERILNDKNRTISNLNSDITYLKSLMAESESQVLDKNKELESSRENCQQLSLQLKKIVHQKNEEIMDLKRQITKMSLTENRASQIIKVSARYQEIIQKRIAEIKSDTVLKELTNFSNAANGDLKRSLNSGSITMEDLENFLETTDRHLRKCAEKRVALQKERDRLLEINRINESDVINIKKFLTELSVSVKTFNSYKEMYSQKISRVILLQRTVRREILKVEERLCEEARCKLERTYAAVMQDLVECALNMERWVERCVARAFSSEKLKQAFMNDLDRASLAPASFQSAALEAQIDELENSFQKVLEEVARALKGEGAAGGRRAAGGGGTVAEVRAEYEDKLTRMKAKMKELYSQEIEVFKERQRREVEELEREVAATRARLAETSGAYEEHIRGLTSELWRLGERLVERDDDRPRAPRTPRTLRAPSLMSLQQMPSSFAVTHAEDQSRASDTHSLRSLPININNKKKEGRGLHMSDEEGEVFDNRYLRELRSPSEAGRGAGAGRASELATPRARGDPSLRLSELRWRNSLCLPHLKSSYPAETQFVAAHEDEIKAVPANATVGGRQRKEVGITAYKKPGPPTPSKQAGRLSATDCELRESLRVEAEPQGARGGAQAGRRTATPSRLRALFTSNRSDAVDGTPRSRRLSNFFRKK